MGTLSKAAVETTLNKLDEISDSLINAIDETQNAVFETADQAVETGEDLGDLAMANIKEAKERVEGLVRAYMDVLTSFLPV